MNDNDWDKLEAARWVTERTGVIDKIQAEQLKLWPRAVFFQSVKSTFTWDPGERAELTQSRVEKIITGLRERGLIQRPPRAARKSKSKRGERTWKRRPEIKFDLVLDAKLQEPPALEKRIEVLVQSLRRMLGDQVRVTLTFNDGKKQVFEAPRV